MILNIFILTIFVAVTDGDSQADIKTATTIREKAFDIIAHQVKYDENIALSPLSIIGAMYMLAAGSAGTSRSEILTALNFGYVFESNDPDDVNVPFEAYRDLITRLQTQPDKGYILDIANGMFHQKNMSGYSSNELDGKYVNLLSKNFIKDVANIQSVDFQNNPKDATELINKWIADKTHDKIPKLFEEDLASDTLVILASSLYFKASWNEKFRLIKHGSKEDQALCWAQSAQALMKSECSENIQWMKKEEDISIHSIKAGFQPIAKIVEIPMKNKKNDDSKDEHKFTMQIWLPEKYITSEDEDKAFREVIKENIGSVRKRMTKQTVNLIMPKFKIEYKDGMIPALQALGIKEVFTDGANLEPMLGNGENAYVSSVDHAVNLNVDEKGVEGAAVTTVQISSRTFHQPTLVQINKPFYFVISNRCWTPGSNGASCDLANVPLFIGRFAKP